MYGLIIASSIILFSGCGWKGTIEIPNIPVPDDIQVKAISYDVAKLDAKKIAKFIQENPSLTCMPNDDFKLIGKELINRKLLIQQANGIISNNNEQSKSWWEVF